MGAFTAQIVDADTVPRAAGKRTTGGVLKR